MANLSSFGARLRSARESKNLTQTELGERINIGSGSISQWERDAGLPRADHLMNLCRVLSVSADYLLDLKNASAGTEETDYGLRWRVISPEQAHAQSKQTQLGIDLFRQLIQNNISAKELLRQHPFSSFHILELQRTLRAVFTNGAVKLLNVPRDCEREQKLSAAYKNRLRSVLVADLRHEHDLALDSAFRTESVAWLASKHITNTLPPAGNVGLTGGHLMSRFVDLVPPFHQQVAGMTWVPLIATNPAHGTIPTSSNTLAARLAHNQPHTSLITFPYLLPAFRSPGQVQADEQAQIDFLNYASRVQEISRNLDCVITTPGEPSFNPKHLDFAVGLGTMKLSDLLRQTSPEERQRCAGVVLLYLVDDHGQRWGSEKLQRINDMSFTSIQLDDLRNLVSQGKPIWFLMDKPQKARSIHASLSSGMGNCLITDAASADALLKLSGSLQ